MGKSGLSGILEYGHGQAIVDVFFPNKECVCKWCSLFLRYEDAFKRYSCRLTGECILDPNHEIGAKCPIVMEVTE